MLKEQLDGDMIFLIHDFLSEEECQQYIDQSESIRYDEAPITTGSGFVMRKDIRNNSRVILDDESLAQMLFERAKDLLPSAWLKWNRLVGFNERWRFYRYDPGQRFVAHTDGYFLRENNDQSQFTFMIYLNDDFKGGCTTFEQRKDPLTGKKPLRVKPTTGTALVFYHHLIHEGEIVDAGRKYVLRTDVMYRQTEET